MTRRQRQRVIAVALLVSDVIGILVAGMVATYVRFGAFNAEVAFEDLEGSIAFWQVLIVVVPLWLAFLALGGLYNTRVVDDRVSTSGQVVLALTLGFVGLVLFTFLAKTPGLSRGWALLLLFFAVCFVLIGRATVTMLVALAHSRGHLQRRVLVVGSNAEAADVVRILNATPEAGLVPVAGLASSQAERERLGDTANGVPLRGTARDIGDVASHERVDAIVIASSAFDHDVLARMIAEVRTLDVDLHLSAGLFEVLTSRVIVSEIAGVPLITVKGISLSRGNLLVKRVFDLLVAGTIVLIGLPVWVLIALVIKFTSRGPVFYGQERVGRAGRHFQMLKFRSMYLDADARLAELVGANEASGPLFKMKDDPRVTPIGRWLRKFSIDEFPQLINVLKGEMSLVGPRPPLPREVERYSVRDWRRLEVVPGMTGLWQVSGRSSLTFDEMVALDLFYIENWSVALDITLMYRTIPAVLFARGAY